MSFTTRSPGPQLSHHHKTRLPHHHKTITPHHQTTGSPHHQVHDYHITSPQDKITRAPCHQTTTGSQDPQITTSAGPRLGGGSEIHAKLFPRCFGNEKCLAEFELLDMSPGSKLHGLGTCVSILFCPIVDFSEKISTT